MAFPIAAAAAAVGSKIMDKGIDYAFARQTAKNNQKDFEKNQKTAFENSQKAQKNAALNEKIGARQAGFSTSFLNGTPQAAATIGGVQGTQTSTGGGDSTISTAFKSQAQAQENKLARRLLEAQVTTAESTAAQSKIKTAGDTIDLTNKGDENRGLMDSYKGYLQHLINETDNPSVKAELQSMLDAGSFSAGSLKGNRNFLAYIKEASEVDLATVANQYQRQIASQNIKNGNAAFIAAMPKQDFLTIVEKLEGIAEDNKNKKLSGEKLNAEVQHISELIKQTAENTESIKNSNWYKMQKDKDSNYLTAQFLNELSRNGPKLLGDAVGDVIGLVRSLMPTSTITKILKNTSPKTISPNKPRNGMGKFQNQSSVPNNFPH